MPATASDTVRGTRSRPLADHATKTVLQVHDELVFEVPERELEWVRREMPQLMTGVAALAVPLVADVGVGANWDEAH
jgi:DNA polymerase-1